MNQWYYAEGSQRHGPLPGTDIVGLFHAARITSDTLVWREGAGQWRPLREFAGELGLGELPAAPPSPAMPPPPMHPPAATAPQPPKPKLSGCALTAIIGAAALVVLVPILAILAAIALPAYQQYTLRSKTAAAHAQLLPLQEQVSAFVQAHERCPGNDDEGFGTPGDLAGEGISSVRIGQFENGHCGIEAQLHMPSHAVLDGRTLWLDYDSDTGAWQCSSDAEDKHLPLGCRND